MKRDGAPNPNDLFWANRGKKSSGPSHWHNTDDGFQPVQGGAADDERQKRNYHGGSTSIRPNSFMNMYMIRDLEQVEGPSVKMPGQKHLFLACFLLALK